MTDKKIVYYSIVKKSDIKVEKLETNQALYVLKKQLNYLNMEFPKIYLPVKKEKII